MQFAGDKATLTELSWPAFFTGYSSSYVFLRFRDSAVKCYWYKGMRHYIFRIFPRASETATPMRERNVNTVKSTLMDLRKTG